MSAAAAYVPAMATSSTPLDLARPHKTLGEDKMCLREDKGTPERKPMRRISGVSGEERCARCQRSFPPEGVQVLEAMGKIWHVECFRCVVCLVPLPETYYEEEGEQYCMEHFYEEYAHKCGKCDDYITGPTMTVGISRMFHPECFVCDKCGVPIGEKDPYTLWLSNRLLCVKCCHEEEYLGSDNIDGPGIDYTDFQRQYSDEGGSSVQHIRIPLANRKPVKFRLEGKVPARKKEKVVHQLLGGVPGFQTPQLPRPGQKKSDNTLKIEKYITS